MVCLAAEFYKRLAPKRGRFHAVVPFDPARDRLLAMDFTAAHAGLTAEVLADTGRFSRYVSQLLQRQGCRYGIGGYLEHRTVYSRSSMFDDVSGEPRRLHLGVDIWGAAGTPVFAPLAGCVHSFARNDHFGDYGATIVLSHEAEGLTFFTLYGHLSAADLEPLYVGAPVEAGQPLAHFGTPEENGQWPPHLHLQVIMDMEGKTGDYPGVCRLSEKERYACNCPDPDILLNMNAFVVGAAASA